jgi:penicillin-binding protein 2
MFFGNPNLREEYTKLKNHPDKPLFNRALAGFYPPGSTFKIVTAAAALNEGRISADTYFTCTGKYELGDRIFRCFGVHGRLKLADAIKKSCTYYFYRVGELVGYELIYKYARLFNFGKTTGIDLTGERGGNVPNNRWKVNRFGEKWYEGDTLNMAIGQGYLMVTPLQVHNVISAIANDGVLMQPHVLKKIKNPRTNTVEKVIYPKVLKTRFLKPEVIEFLQKAMREASRAGTSAWVATIAPKVQIAGKTGTAQNPFGAPHSWFTSFGGFELPLDQRVAITVLVENNEAGGGAVAAPIAAILYNYVYQMKSKDACLKDLKNILNVNIRRSTETTETSPAAPHSHYNTLEQRRVREYHRDLQRNTQRQQGEGDDENIED